MQMLCWLAATGLMLLLLSGAAADQVTEASERNSPAVQPAQARPLGGVQLALEPRRAQVYVDGMYAGVVDDFAGYYRHLPLPAGNHRIEVFASGYLPLIFDVTVVPDRTITYRQSLVGVSSAW
jgi:PEGA domain